jgi:putative CocE/NonD family hydrolase
MKRIVDNFSNSVRDIEETGIPMPDGTRLSARIWMPEDAETRPVPAILEYIPYRKRDLTRNRDEPMHRYFAGHGYACLRVDLRGAGESEGLLNDEYLQSPELDDALSVIAWIAEQPWCNGRVGMMGKSWGGFNALQVAALQPPALDAIIAVAATDDRYADDIHFMGGCLLNDNLMWSATMLTFNTRPPDSEIVGERWLDMWKERLEANHPWALTWLEHQRRDAYWRHGSICENYDAIQVPVYAITGWSDGYSNAIPRMMAGLKVPRRGVIGPWAHVYPHDGTPGPAIGFLQDALRWWDRWLKDRDTGIDREPLYRVWMQESVPPAVNYAHRPGRWVAEESWPSSAIENRVLHLHGNGSLEPAKAAPRQLAFRSPASTGIDGGEWCGFGLAGELAGDQRAEDGRSLTFETAPLDARMEILGAPVAELTLASDKPVAQLAVRLCDVVPDGASTLVTYGVLNLTHRDSHARPEPLEPGRAYRIRVQLNDIAHAFPAGHRLRLGLSTCYWPLVWPSPEAATLTLATGDSALSLPVREPRAGDDALPAFEEPETAPDVPVSPVAPGSFQRSVVRDKVSGEVLGLMTGEGGFFGIQGTYRIDPIGTEIAHTMNKRMAIHDDDPLCASMQYDQTIGMKRGDWEIRVAMNCRQWSTTTHFIQEVSVDAWHGDAMISSRKWAKEIERDLV